MSSTLDVPVGVPATAPLTGQVRQAPAAVVVVRPHHFRPNPQTLVDNAFQPRAVPDDVAGRAFAEVSGLVETLTGHGVAVHLVEDTGTTTPDSVFCNNWFSTHPDGTVVLYPMHAPNRRGERRADVLDLLAEHHAVRRFVDLAEFAAPGQALEGTGAMVLDHGARTAYLCRSRRTDPALLQRFCELLGFRSVVFGASAGGVPVYHTNVVLWIGETVAAVGADLVDDPAERRNLLAELEASGREVVRLTNDQVRSFAGNCLELQGREPLLALSRTAERSLDPRTRSVLEQHLELVPVDVATLELAGGSVRCTLGGVHLPDLVAVAAVPAG